jgi:carboxylesterase
MDLKEMTEPDSMNYDRDPISGIIKGAESIFLKRGDVGCLLMHGFSSSPTEMKDLAEFLAERDITVSAPLLPGHGTNPMFLNDVTDIAFVEAADRAFEDLKRHCRSVFLCGSSFGAILAVHLAARKKVSGLILLAPLFRINQSGFSLVSEELKVRLLHPFFKFKKKENLAATRDKSVLEQHIAYDRIPLKGLAAALRIVNMAKREMADIYCPLLLIHSEYDSVSDIQGTRKMAGIYSGLPKEIHWLKRSDHVLLLDYDRDYVKRKCLEFISEFGN